MPPLRLAVLVALALFAGCVSPAIEQTGPGTTASTTVGIDAEPTVHEWRGYVVASQLEGPTHVRPTEDLLWPVFQEGILFSIDEAPQVLEVSLSWEGAGEMMIMLHSHKEHGTNTYVEHVSEMDAENPKCIRVPTEDIVPGVWQVMVHSRNVRQSAFTLSIALTGGAGHIVEDDRHGHWLQDGSFEVEDLEAPVLEPVA
ncbi:MAG TPA: hypothetical protein VM582_00020, partial [Candidatus Thermoplasmatota archaeon]|nr:hypothetical protein [Candidatus Thermoplasmatota archaeon]